MRKIDDNFIKDLKEDCLSFFLNQIKQNPDKLCLEVRDGYINIYYRGGNLLRITQKKKGYRFFFDPKYCLNKDDNTNYALLSSLDKNSAQAYIDNFDLMMSEMDSWLKKHPKKEREIQHKLLINNPNIIDIEYATPKCKKSGIKLNMRLDMLMVEGDKLIIVENKYGIGAIKGDSGIKDHYDAICKLFNTQEAFEELVESVEEIAKAKHELGLLKTPIQCIDKTKVDIVFLFVDYNENSGALKSELEKTTMTYPASMLKMSSDDLIIDFSKVEKI